MTLKKLAGPPTVSDVARLAKVSTATVSRTINQPDSVRSELRARVLEAVRTLGYIPNAGARALMLNRSGTIGVVIPTLTNTIFAQSLAGFQQRMGESSYQVIVACSEFNAEFESEQILNLVKRGVEAIALTGTSQEPWILRLLKQRELPYIHVVCRHAPLNGYTIGFENDKAMNLVVDHLLELGHKYIGVLIGVTKDNDRAAGRLRGVKEALQKEGLHLPHNRIVESSYHMASARQGLRALLKEAPETTAVICGNDLIAQGAILEAQHSGLVIPRDLSIIGFDDFEMSAHTLPGLTTIRTEAQSMWSKAADHLIGQLNKDKSLARHVPTEVSLIVRDSTAAPRKLKLKSGESPHSHPLPPTRTPERSLGNPRKA